MKPISAFQTTDGQLFAQERNAALHQMWLDKQSTIEDFMNDPDFPYHSTPQRAIARTVITQWELWKNRGAK